MTKNLRFASIGALVLATVALAGCSPSQESQQESFDFSGASLSVINDNSNMPVTVTALPDGAQNDEVVVEIHSQTMGKGAETPAWSLEDGVLNLGSPCGGSWFGYCEGSYSVQVPDGTEVTVNGSPVAVG